MTNCHQLKNDVYKRKFLDSLLPVEAITGRIYVVRGHKIILDRDLAGLYGVETGQLKQAVRRNMDRFPSDLCSSSREEFENWRCQFGTLIWGGTRYPPMAFTEQGVAMLSGVINSTRAIQVNIAIMRAFVQMRQLLSSNKKFAEKLKALEKRLTEHDKHFQIVFVDIKQMFSEGEKPKRKIGF